MNINPKNLFLILGSDDWNVLQKHVLPGKNNAFFVWHTDLSTQDLKAIRDRGDLYTEDDFLTFSERKNLNTKIMGYIQDLFAFKQECGYGGISWIDVLFYEVSFPFTIHGKLNEVLPRLYAKVVPEHVYLVKRKSLETKTAELILKSLGSISIKSCFSLKMIWGWLWCSTWTVQLSNMMKSIRYWIRRLYRRSNQAILKNDMNIMLLGNISHDGFDEAFQICQKKGLDAIKVVRSLSAHHKDQQRTFCIETLYAEFLSKAKPLRQALTFEPLWDHFFKDHPELSREIWKPLVACVNYKVQRCCLDLAVSYFAFEVLLTKLPVQGVLVWNDNLWWERLLVLMARQRGIRTYLFLHGIWSDLDEAFELLICDSIGVWGKLPFKLAQAKGISQGRLQIVGNPSLERLFMSRQALPKVERISSQRPQVLLITSPPPEYRIYCAAFAFEESRRMQEYVCEATRDLDMDLILKTRGPKDTKRYEKWVQSSAMDQDISIVYQKPLEQLIYEADIVVSYESTVILEAMILHKPVILLDVMGILENCFYKVHQAVLYAQDVASLKVQMVRILQEPHIVEELDQKGQDLVVKYTHAGLEESRVLLAEWLFSCNSLGS
jgi:hypothetical protein